MATVIAVKNEKQSAKVQEALSAYWGIVWATGATVKYTKMPYLIIKSNGYLGYAQDKEVLSCNDITISGKNFLRKNKKLRSIYLKWETASANEIDALQHKEQKLNAFFASLGL